MKIALIQPPLLQPWEEGEIDRISGLVKAHPHDAGFELVQRTGDADLVVLLESCSFKTQRDIAAYAALVAEHGAGRLFCINYEDGPPGFLPGLYSSLEDFRFEPALHLSWPHLKLPNARADAGGVGPAEEEPSLLFTFSGACSHPLRRVLFEHFEDRPGRHKVREIKRWYNHNDAEHSQYVLDIRQSKFVLCPRGIASYSHRILETLALGRVPVVIGDHWVPFSLPEQGWCLHIAENQLARIDEVLADAEGGYAALRSRAREVYLRHFTPRERYAVALAQLVGLQQRCRVSAAELQARWTSRQFWQRNGWTLQQRMARKLRRWAAV